METSKNQNIENSCEFVIAKIVIYSILGLGLIAIAGVFFMGHFNYSI